MGADQSTASGNESGLGKIVVVNKGASDKDHHEAQGDGNTNDKSEVDELIAIPSFLPLLKDSISGLTASSLTSNSAVKSSTTLTVAHIDKLDSRAIMHYCMRYQEHLKSCAEAISFDQNNLCSQIKDLDFALKQFNEILMERQKKYARFAEQLNKLQEMTHVLIRVRSNADGLVQTMERLNSMLPEGEQLEPFRFLPEID